MEIRSFKDVSTRIFERYLSTPTLVKLTRTPSPTLKDSLLYVNVLVKVHNWNVSVKKSKDRMFSNYKFHNQAQLKMNMDNFHDLVVKSHLRDRMFVTGYDGSSRKMPVNVIQLQAAEKEQAIAEISVTLDELLTRPVFNSGGRITDFRVVVIKLNPNSFFQVLELISDTNSFSSLLKGHFKILALTIGSDGKSIYISLDNYGKKMIDLHMVPKSELKERSINYLEEQFKEFFSILSGNDRKKEITKIFPGESGYCVREFKRWADDPRGCFVHRIGTTDIERTIFGSCL